MHMYIKIETNANIDMETGVLLNYLCFVCDSIAQKSFEYSLVVSVFSYTVGVVHPPSLTGPTSNSRLMKLLNKLGFPSTVPRLASAR